MEFLLLFLLLGAIVWEIGRGKTKKTLTPFIKKLLDKHLITKDQASDITDFENTERIRKWVKQKLITKEQADAILYGKGQAVLPTKQEEKTFHISIVTAICYLALGSILLGIIAIIAANYQKIPPAVRAMSTLTGLIIISFTCFYAYIKQKGRALELFLVAGIGLIGANIATISQWFQLDGKPADALLVWSILSLCFISLSKKEFWGYLWYPITFIIIMESSYADSIWNFLRHYIPSPITGMFGCLTLYLISKRIAPMHSLSKALKLYVLVAAVILAMMFDVHLTTQKQMTLPILTNADLVFRNAMALIILAAYPIYVYRKNRLAVCAGLGTMVIALISFLVRAPVLGMLMTLFLLSLSAAYMVKRNDLKAFNFLIFLMFIRLVLAYFHLFSTLATTGIGLIILGILILLGVLLYSKLKNKLIQYIKDRI